MAIANDQKFWTLQPLVDEAKESLEKGAWVKIDDPLNLNDEYMLVDTDGYCDMYPSNEDLVSKYDLTSPFKLSEATISGYNGCINGDYIIGSGEFQFFRVLKPLSN